jgi:hydrogenase maturation protease
MSDARRVLVAGIGNIFLGDDGFGVEVVRRLRVQPMPEGVDVADFGVRGIHLAYELADGQYESAILIDAVPRGERPGTLYTIEPDVSDVTEQVEAADAHSLTPAAVLSWLKRIGGASPRITIVGCEPASVDEAIGLSQPVAAAVDGAMAMVRDLVRARVPSCA